MSGPVNQEIEAGLVAKLLADPDRIGEVVGNTLIEPRHFGTAAPRLLFEALVEAFYAGDPIDSLVIAEIHAKQLSKLWGCDEQTAVRRVGELPAPATAPVELAKLVRRDSDYRELLRVAERIREEVDAEKLSPEEIAGQVSQRAMQVSATGVAGEEIVTFADAGRQLVRELRVAQEARARGVELGAYFGIPAIDDYTTGVRGGELLIAGGEPGVGKSGVWWRAGLNFAERMAKRPEEERIGVLVLSLEMSPTPSNMRFASMLAGLSGTDLRRGDISGAELQTVVREWRERAEIPLFLNYAPTLRASQLRALISEAIRRHNVGVVIIDHFRMWDLDERLPNKVDEDEEKVRFLKEQLASALNIAVICLAHTRKPDRTSNGRPRLSDLRGSGQIAAHSDFVSFIFRPWMYASETERNAGSTDITDAEMIWEKNRHGIEGTEPFYFDPSRMFVA